MNDDHTHPRFPMIPYSLLDLSPVAQEATVRQALKNTVELARYAEELGYNRYWLAEHHNMAGIASSATSVLIGHVAGMTQSIRVGSGGIMLPNHAPLVIAEQFGTLATLYPDRIDLGLGRAPGTDLETTRALRRSLHGPDSFPRDVVELISYLWDETPTGRVRAIPGLETRVPVWILGSSIYGAQLAAQLGLPYAFASHFAPAALEAALAIYRENFRPSALLDQSRFMLAVNVFAGEEDEDGRLLMSSAQLAFANLRAGRPGKLPQPHHNVEAMIDPSLLSQVNHALSVSAIGSPASVKAALRSLIERYRPDELILTGTIHDHQARLRSFGIAAQAMREMARRAGES
jgi:luciferase family oxidoreductase group 1